MLSQNLFNWLVLFFSKFVFQAQGWLQGCTCFRFSTKGEVREGFTKGSPERLTKSKFSFVVSHFKSDRRDWKTCQWIVHSSVFKFVCSILFG